MVEVPTGAEAQKIIDFLFGLDLKKIILMVVIVFAAAKLAALLFNRIGVPGLVGEILVGVALTSIVIGDQSIAEHLGIYTTYVSEGVTKRSYYLIDILSDIGVMFLLFSVGLETRAKDLLSVGKAAMLVATLGVLLPFILGYVYVVALGDGDTYHAMFLGAAMVATSVGITARVIKDMKLTETREARIIIGAAVIDDVLGMVVLAIVQGMAKSGSLNIGEIFLTTFIAIAFVAVIMLLALFGVPRIYDFFENRKARKIAENPDYIPKKYNMLAIAIATCLGMAFLAEFMGLAAIIGSFLAGMLFAEYSVRWGLDEKIEAICTFLVSFFFVYVGIQVDVSGITGKVLLTALIIIVLAMIGKYVGCGLGAKLGDKKTDMTSMSIIGIGMIPRGEVGIIVASIGYTGGYLSGELYTIVVFMSVLTTIIAPPFLSIAFRKKYKPEYEIQSADTM